MKIFVKKGNRFKHLGEGRIYSKSELRLNEYANDKVSLTLNPNGQNVNASNIQTAARNMMNKVPQSTAVTVQADDINGVTPPMFSANDPRNDTVQTIAAKNATGVAIQNAAKNGGTIQITKDNTNQSGLGESRMIEMRRNSIPFSKKELSKFLKTL